MYHGFFPASYTSKYLENYLDSHSSNGQSLLQRVLLGHEVAGVAKISDTWTITCENTTA